MLTLFEISIEHQEGETRPKNKSLSLTFFPQPRTPLNFPLLLLSIASYDNREYPHHSPNIYSLNPWYIIMYSPLGAYLHGVTNKEKLTMNHEEVMCHLPPPPYLMHDIRGVFLTIETTNWRILIISNLFPPKIKSWTCCQERERGGCRKARGRGVRTYVPTYSAAALLFPFLS